MEYAFTHKDGLLVAKIAGRLDANSVPQLEGALNAELVHATDVVFDFEQLEFISSAGLRILLSTYKRVRKSGTMRLVNVQENVLDVLRVSGFADIFIIE